MPEVNVYNPERQKVASLKLAEGVFGVPLKRHLLHEVVRMQLARRRAGTAKTKSRAEVRGGGRKPWRQKGTGRARVGSIRSPLWRGGGIVFGPAPRSYEPRVPKRVRRQALKVALSAKLRDEELLVVEGLGLERIKTKDFLKLMEGLGLRGKSTLIVTEGQDERLAKSARNVPGVKVLAREGLNVYDILRYERLVLSRGAAEKIGEALGA